jgi:crotonobetainyl-CoA:carnitine CoA-transferase CaiB-like acyl-CoA transferase
VYCSLTGYGQDGPYRDRAGHDVDYLALGGFLGGNRDGEGNPVLPTTQVADMTAGLLTAFAVLVALHARERTGRGQHVDVSLLRAALALMSVPLARAQGGPADELTGAYPGYSVYRCRDGGAVAVGALEPKFWERLCDAVGRPELAPRQWVKEPRAALAALFASRDRDDWVSALAPRDACVEPVLALHEVAAHPAVDGALIEVPVGAARLRTVAPPVRFAGTPAAPPAPPPALGEHTDEVLGEAGFTRGEVERLRREGVLA